MRTISIGSQSIINYFRKPSYFLIYILLKPYELTGDDPLYLKLIIISEFIEIFCLVMFSLLVVFFS